MDSPYWKGPLPGVDVQRRYLWKTFRGKPNSIPGSARKCSASARNPVRLHPGMLFGFSPESCSTCPGMLFGLPRNTHAEAVPLHGSLRCGKPRFVRGVLAIATDIEFKPPIGVVIVRLVLAGIEDGSEPDASVNGAVHAKRPGLHVAVGSGLQLRGKHQLRRSLLRRHALEVAGICARVVAHRAWRMRRLGIVRPGKPDRVVGLERH